MITIVANCSEWIRGTKLHPHRPHLLIRANMGCAVATIFSSLAFLSSFISMANLSRLVDASFPNLTFLLSTTFSRLRFLSNSLSSPRFNLLRVARSCFSWFSVFFFSRLILGLSFLYVLQSLMLYLLNFSFISERLFFVHAKSALAL